ncbi:hypothetical protein PoB_001320500 [Plakobranchus ocellatus]|uniref:Uncharacterized protein n=1 Tax=Plakobranchus ocellatus TaxID=259542 RepID=A0AAV3YV29_9GAST|nr:hypothetical protein PoB_001320500 [Plakobranchus ocellatus]
MPQQPSAQASSGPSKSSSHRDLLSPPLLPFSRGTVSSHSSSMLSTAQGASSPTVTVSVPVSVPASPGQASPQQGDLRLSGPPSGQGAGSGVRTRDRRIPADIRADSLATVPPTLPTTTERSMSGERKTARGGGFILTVWNNRVTASGLANHS